MPSHYDVVVYGMVCLDTIWRVREWPAPGGYARVLEERVTIGGEAANSAIALARWGVRVALIGNALGDDEAGHRLRALFSGEAPEIDPRFLPLVPGAVTPSFVCVASEDGHRTTLGLRATGLRWQTPRPELVAAARVLTLDPYGGRQRFRRARPPRGPAGRSSPWIAPVFPPSTSGRRSPSPPTSGWDRRSRGRNMPPSPPASATHAAPQRS